MTREERISSYESMMDQALQAAAQMEEALAVYDAAAAAVSELEKYYASQQWKDDLAADEAGLLSADLRRGVLSEDGLYDLLERYSELARRVRPDQKMH